MFWQVPAYAAAAYFSYLALQYLVSTVSLWSRCRAARRDYGCEEPTRYPHRYPLGIDLILERKKAVEEGRYNPLWTQQYQKYGSTWSENQLGLYTINTVEPENRHTVLSSKAQDYQPPPHRNAAILPFLGRGIFSERGSRWRHSRDLITPIFARTERSHDLDMFRAHVDRFLAKIPTDGETVDLQVLFNKLFLDSTTQFIFGESLGSLTESPTPGTNEFLNAFQRALIGAGRRGNLGAGKAGIMFLFDKKWQEDCTHVHSFVDKYVERALAATADGKENQDDSDRDQSRYLLINEMALHIRDPVQLRSEILNVFFPSRDATSIALSNTLFNLARKPAIWQDLRAEAAALGDKPLTFELLMSLKLFRYTIYEAIRLQGPTGRASRGARNDTILPTGGGKDGKSPVFVPAGSIVALNNYPVNHDEAIWGGDVEDYRPARWVGKEKEYVAAGFRPFLEGPRTCPARQQVLTQSVYLLVRLVQEFSRIENRDPCLEYVERIRMLTESKNGVQVALFKAKT